VFWILFLKKTKFGKKTHNMLFFMLDLRFKSLGLVSLFFGWEEGVSFVDEYDRRTLFPMFFKCYHHLHPMTECIGCVNQTSDEDSKLDIFKQIYVHKWAIKGTCHQGIIDIQTLPSGSQKHQISSSMVGKTWSYVSYNCFFHLSNLKHYRFTNWNRKNFFFGVHTYKSQKLLFTFKLKLQILKCLMRKV
jgi:uncharacterized membrane protein